MGPEQYATRPPPGRNRRRQLIALSVFLVLVLGFFAFVWSATQHNAAYAKVGDCVAVAGTDSIKIVGCADSSAAFKVVARVEGKTEVDASMDACDPYVAQGAEQVYWQGSSGAKGMVLCLAKNAR